MLYLGMHPSEQMGKVTQLWHLDALGTFTDHLPIGNRHIFHHFRGKMLVYGRVSHIPIIFPSSFHHMCHMNHISIMIPIIIPSHFHQIPIIFPTYSHYFPSYEPTHFTGGDLKNHRVSALGTVNALDADPAMVRA